VGEERGHFRNEKKRERLLWKPLPEDWLKEQIEKT
jgi:hypothetical protein